MRRVVFLLIALTAGCPKKEEVTASPEAKPSASASAAPEVEHPIETLTCRDGVLGVASPVDSSFSPGPPSPVPLPSASALPADADGGMFAPIGAGGVTGLGGIGVIGSASVKTGGGVGLARLRGVRITGVPLETRGARAAAFAKGMCAASEKIKACHHTTSQTFGTIDVELTIAANGKVTSAKRTGGDVADDALIKCVEGALGADPFAPEAKGTARYRLTFERVGGKPIGMKEVAPTATGKLPVEVIRRVLRAHFPRIRKCYEYALESNPTLSGKMNVSFTIDEKGAVRDAKITDGIPEIVMRGCVLKVVETTSFPEPDGGRVQVTYPIEFTPAQK